MNPPNTENQNPVDPPSPSASDAASALSQAHTASETGLHSGRKHSRRFAVGIAIWAGLVAASVASPFLLIVLFGGLVAYWMLKNQQHARLVEVESPRQFWLVILPLGLLAGVLIVFGGYLRQAHGLALAPLVMGAFITIFLLTLNEIGYRSSLRRLASEKEA